MNQDCRRAERRIEEGTHKRAGVCGGSAVSAWGRAGPDHWDHWAQFAWVCNDILGGVAVGVLRCA
jgi:hypothetical protein